MDTQRLAVVQYGDEWRVVDQEGRRGEPLDYEEALVRAEVLARRARWQGLDVDVLVQRGIELSEHLSFRAPPEIGPSAGHDGRQ